MAAQRAVDPMHLVRFTRFLHTGLEEPKYFPGSWSSHQYFEMSKLNSLNSILEAEPICQTVIDIIVKTYNDRLFTRYETIAFALAKCLLIGCYKMKQLVYDVVPSLCSSPEELLTFANFTFRHKTGSGAGWCRAVSAWYCGMEPLQLAAEVTRVKSLHGRSHMNLLRRSHVKIAEDDYARDAIFKYLMFGLKQTRATLGSRAEAAPVLAYIQRVDELRHCEDPAAAADMVRVNNFGLQHVPGHFLTSQDVWEVVLPQLTLSELLSNLLRIHNMGFLTSESATTAIVVSLLTNADYVRKSKVTPLAVYIAIASYNRRHKPLKNAKVKIATEKRERRRLRQVQDPVTKQWVWASDKAIHSREAKIRGIDAPQNSSVQAALQKTLELSWPIKQNNSIKYLITMDMRPHMFKGKHFCAKPVKKATKPKKGQAAPAAAAAPAPAPAPEPAAATAAESDATPARGKSPRPYAECFYHECVTPGDAALVLALWLYKRERNVRLAVFTEAGVQPVELHKDRRPLTLDALRDKLTSMTLGRVKVAAPIEWAGRSNTAVDVFINMLDRQSRYLELESEARTGRGHGGRYAQPPQPGVPDNCPVRALESYRLQLNVPHARLITMSLATHKVGTTDGSHRGILDIVGIDEHVPKLIEAFAARHFD